MASTAKQIYLFGGDKKWNPEDWVASDDRVRGGMSQSFLDCDPTNPTARFHGNLDIKTLGGAGFASQRTTGENRCWDLSGYGELELVIEEADAKQYTLILKDALLPRNPDDGREQSTVSYEYDFRVDRTATSSETKLNVPWSELNPTYRGREKKDAPPINLKSVKRVSLMMRSFFGTQEGPFELSVRSIAAVYRPKSGETPEASTQEAGKGASDATWGKCIVS